MDRREEILIKCDEESDGYGLVFDGNGKLIFFDGKIQTIYNAMDENGKRLCLELLEYMAKKNIVCGFDNEGCYFIYGNKSHTKEQLFENFL